jgi:hypothetical protein
MRTTDLLTWQAVANLAPIPKFQRVDYSDTNLQPDTRYCYAIESFNALGARRSGFTCTYTRFDDDVDIWRLQLRVNIANVANAGIDHPLIVSTGSNGQYYGVATYLDYGHDDFERNSDFIYDLNMGHIRKLSDIVDISVAGSGDDTDIALVEDLALLVNGHTVFSRHFGRTATSALRLGQYRVERVELHSDPLWLSYIASSRNDELFNLPHFDFSDNDLLPFQIKIPPDQIVSRIESLVGHVQHAEKEVGDWIKWGHLNGPAVEIMPSGISGLHVDLDLEVTIPLSPNPALDIDFDIELTKQCTDNNQLVVGLLSKNFTSDADFSLWKDVASAGTLKVVDKVADWLLGEHAPLPIEQSFAVSLPSNVDCTGLVIGVDAETNLTVCCFAVPPSPPG